MAAAPAPAGVLRRAAFSPDGGRKSPAAWIALFDFLGCVLEVVGVRKAQSRENENENENDG